VHAETLRRHPEAAAAALEEYLRLVEEIFEVEKAWFAQHDQVLLRTGQTTQLHRDPRASYIAQPRAQGSHYVPKGELPQGMILYNDNDEAVSSANARVISTVPIQEGRAVFDLMAASDKELKNRFIGAMKVFLPRDTGYHQIFQAIKHLTPRRKLELRDGGLWKKFSADDIHLFAAWVHTRGEKEPEPCKSCSDRLKKQKSEKTPGEGFFQECVAIRFPSQGGAPRQHFIKACSNCISTGTRGRLCSLVKSKTAADPPVGKGPARATLRPAEVVVDEVWGGARLAILKRRQQIETTRTSKLLNQQLAQAMSSAAQLG